MTGDTRPFCALVATLVSAPLLASALPVTLVHTGYLVGEGDVPLTRPALPVTFALFTAASGGAQAWPASGAAPCTADVKAGYFALAIGQAGCGSDLTSEALPAGSARFLEVTIDGAVLAPRLSIAALPFAAAAQRATTTDALGGRSLLAVQAEFDARYARMADGSSGPVTLATSGSTTLALPTSGTVITADGAAAISGKSLGGALLFALHGASDLGAGAARARDLWLSRNLDAGGSLNAATAVIGAVSAGAGGVSVAGGVVQAPEVRAGQFVSTAAQGTAPLVVSSATKVANLNADLWGGARLSMPLGCPSGSVLRGLVFAPDGVTLQADCTPVLQTRGTSPNPGESCWEIRSAHGSAALPDGQYWVDPDGASGVAAFLVYCDMNTDGGGWTLVDNDATNEGFIASRTAGATTSLTTTKGSYLPAYKWSGAPQLLVRSSYASVGATANWVSFNAVNALALEYPLRNTQSDGGRTGEWTVAQLNGNTNQGTASWIFIGATTRIATVWIGSGSQPTAACSYEGNGSTGLGRYTSAATTTCSTWVR